MESTSPHILSKFISISVPHIATFDLEYQVTGEGKPVVFVPGARVDFHHLKPLFESLQANCKIYTFRFPDHQYCDLLGELHPEIYYQVIDAFAAAMQLENFSIIGQSLGGGLVIPYAALNPDKVERVVCISPIVTPEKRSILSGYIALWRGIRQRTKMEQSNKSLWEIVANIKHWRTTHKVIKMFREFDARPYYNQINQPTLIFVAGQDLLVPPVPQLEAASKISSATLEYYPEIGHSLIHIKAPEVGAKIVNFLQQ